MKLRKRNQHLGYEFTQDEANFTEQSEKVITEICLVNQRDKKQERVIYKIYRIRNNKTTTN